MKPLNLLPSMLSVTRKGVNPSTDVPNDIYVTYALIRGGSRGNDEQNMSQLPT